MMYVYGSGFLQNIALGNLLAMLLQISFLTIRHREKGRSPSGNRICLFRSLLLPWSFNLSLFASDYLLFFSLLHVQKEMVRSKQNKTCVFYMCMAYLPVAMHNHLSFSHTLFSFYFSFSLLLLLLLLLLFLRPLRLLSILCACRYHH